MVPPKKKRKLWKEDLHRSMRHLDGYKSFCGKIQPGEVDLGVISLEMVVFKNDSEWDNLKSGEKVRRSSMEEWNI